MKTKLLISAMILTLLACDKTETYVQSDVEVPVKIEEITLKPIEEFVVTTGTVKATVDVVVNSEIEGAYTLNINPETKRPFALGDFVKKGRVIVSLVNPEQVIKIRFESVKLSLENAKEDLDQKNSLFKTGGVSQIDVKKAEQALLDAQYNYDNALIQQTNFKITAPTDGIIVNLPYYTPGLEIPANSEIVHIMDYRVLNLEVNLPGKLLGAVKENQNVRVTSYMLKDKQLDAVITQVSPVLEPSTRTFKAKLNINNSDLLLRPGMFVKAEIITADNPSAIVIPKEIILVRRNEKTVFIISEGVARQRKITTGLENPDMVEVIDGLEEDDFLVIEGFETLRNGSKVTISK